MRLTSSILTDYFSPGWSVYKQLFTACQAALFSGSSSSSSLSSLWTEAWASRAAQGGSREGQQHQQLQGSFSSGVRVSAGRAADADEAFAFAVAHRSHAELSRALLEALRGVEEQLGARPPHLLHLLVHGDYSRQLSAAPQFLNDHLRRGRHAPHWSPGGMGMPVVVGGVVEGLARSPSAPPPSSSSTEAGSAPRGVSLLAAHLPGVRLWPFHTATAALPALGPGAWEALLAPHQHPPDQPPGAPPHRAACLLLAEPHFLGVERLTERLGAVLGEGAVLRGVMRPSAWGAQRSLRGALFCGRRTYDQGAVGVALAGPLQLSTLTAQACQPVGEPAEVTEAEEHGSACRVRKLDGVAVLDKVLAWREEAEAALRGGGPGGRLAFHVYACPQSGAPPQPAHALLDYDVASGRFDARTWSLGVPAEEGRPRCGRGSVVQPVVEAPSTPSELLESWLQAHLAGLDPGSAAPSQVGGILYGSVPGPAALPSLDRLTLQEAATRSRPVFDGLSGGSGEDTLTVGVLSRARAEGAGVGSSRTP